MNLPNKAGSEPAPRLQVLSHGAVMLLRRLLLIVLVAAIVDIFLLLWGHRISLGNIAPFDLLLIVGLCYRELAAGRTERGLVLLCWATWLSACAFSYFIAGLRTPFLIGIPMVLMSTAWVQGRRAALTMVSLTLVHLVVLTVVEYQGWLPPPVQRRTIDFTVTYVVVSVFSAAIAVSLVEAFQHLYRQERDLGEELRSLNETLEQRVDERTEEYELANQSLQETVEQLERTRSELVHSEKLSALGSMVAGVSHELNTPLGNAKLALSTLRDRMQVISESYRAGSLTRNQIVEFFQEGREVVELANRSVDRAVGLVESFKQVAVDQTSERRRSFNLSTVIEETLDTLRPGFKRQPWQFTVEVPLDIEMDSYPGPFEQIVINLVHNSVRHGFDGREQGMVTIGAYRESAAGDGEEGGQVVITFTDDGVGIAAENLGRVFDPFFTTQLGKGGSGIGLNIVHRLASTVLGGSIAVESEPGKGTVFTLTIPQRAPMPS
ncbi:MAG: HAMP domain-containing histidine kinase [Burkholderiaceae bacterium]|nr:HAMP domain-containing histidine kinase [Burkholderiaceae bacterium]